MRGLYSSIIQQWYCDHYSVFRSWNHSALSFVFGSNPVPTVIGEIKKILGIYVKHSFGFTSYPEQYLQMNVS